MKKQLKELQLKITDLKTKPQSGKNLYQLMKLIGERMELKTTHRKLYQKIYSKNYYKDNPEIVIRAVTKYNKTDKGIRSRSKYNKSETNKARQKRYEKTEKAKKRHAKYQKHQ